MERQTGQESLRLIKPRQIILSFERTQDDLDGGHDTRVSYLDRRKPYIFCIYIEIKFKLIFKFKHENNP